MGSVKSKSTSLFVPPSERKGASKLDVALRRAHQQQLQQEEAVSRREDGRGTFQRQSQGEQQRPRTRCRDPKGGVPLDSDDCEEIRRTGRGTRARTCVTSVGSGNVMTCTPAGNRSRSCKRSQCFLEVREESTATH